MKNQTSYQRLFESINIGSLKLKNRIVMAPMATGFFSSFGLVTEQAKAYYEARAKGGVGLVIVESSSMDFPRGHGPNRANIDSDLTITGLKSLAEAIQKQGARAAIQIYHCGRLGNIMYSGISPITPSSAPNTQNGIPPNMLPEELTVRGINEIVEFYGKAAARAKKAGFNGIELHAAHGYLISQFLSPVSNKRQDEYGGSLENRSRILLEILKVVRSLVGDDYPVWYRINGHESGMEGALSLDEVKKIVEMTRHLIDAVHVSAQEHGRMSSLVEMPDVPGRNLYLAEEIRKIADVPVIAVGRIDPDLGEKALADGKADMIAMGRWLIADPDLPNKIKTGKQEDIRPCTACFHCSDVRSPTISRIYCAINPVVGAESTYELNMTKAPKKIVVIGGGPAGMVSSHILAHRGHHVKLLEKEDYLGGQIKLSCAGSRKNKLFKPLIVYLEKQLYKHQVDVRLNNKVSIQAVEDMNPDVVIVATGAKPLIPELPGINLNHVLTSFDVLSGKKKTSGRIAIIGGGSTGLETAEFLYEQGKEVTVIEMSSELANNIGMRDRTRLLSVIESLPITFHTAKCTEIKSDGVVVVSDNHEERVVEAETVILALGTRPDNELFLQLKRKKIETYFTGDCWRLGNIVGAIGDATELASAI